MQPQPVLLYSFQEYHSKDLPEQIENQSQFFNSKEFKSKQSLKQKILHSRMRMDDQQQSSVQKKKHQLDPLSVNFSKIYSGIQLQIIKKNIPEKEQDLSKDISLLYDKSLVQLPKKIPRFSYNSKEINLKVSQDGSINESSKKFIFNNLSLNKHKKALTLFKYDIFQSNSKPTYLTDIQSSNVSHNKSISSNTKNEFFQNGIKNQSNQSVEVQFEIKQEQYLPQRVEKYNNLSKGVEQSAKDKSNQKQADHLIPNWKGQQQEIQFYKETFSIAEYSKVYQSQKKMQVLLKKGPSDQQLLLREIKVCLEIIASGKLDSFCQLDFHLPLHRKKVIKIALLYERIAVVIIGFAIAIGELAPSVKILINLLSYTTTNNLLIIKIYDSFYPQQQPVVSTSPVLARSEKMNLSNNINTIRNNNQMILDCILKVSKLDEAFYMNFKQIMKEAVKMSLDISFYQILEYFAFFICFSSLHQIIPFLAVAPNPYLPATLSHKYTLVIDTIQVFCHPKKSKNNMFRPHAHYFLKELSKHYQIISFTQGFPNQIDKIIDIMDPQRIIEHRLYQHHIIQKKGKLIKDMERLGRDLDKIILLEVQDSNYTEGKQIGFRIPSWRSFKNDTVLVELCAILVMIAVKKMNCRQAITKMKQQKSKNYSEGIKYLNFGLNLE